ncbi:hypothetical protein [Flavobacterium sp. JP2137]|uniref:hypothetical protein n=1 Tax=Flavobacterium sp. JP2137 TaxID=3414510 RepID=UPI003D3014B7
MFRFFSIWYFVLMAVCLQAQPKGKFGPKIWLKDPHALSDSVRLNGYGSLSFLKDLKVLTKRNILGKHNVVYAVYQSRV